MARNNFVTTVTAELMLSVAGCSSTVSVSCCVARVHLHLDWCCAFYVRWYCWCYCHFVSSLCGMFLFLFLDSHCFEWLKSGCILCKWLSRLLSSSLQFWILLSVSRCKHTVHTVSVLFSYVLALQQLHLLPFKLCFLVLRSFVIVCLASLFISVVSFLFLHSCSRFVLGNVLGLSLLLGSSEANMVVCWLLDVGCFCMLAAYHILLHAGRDYIVLQWQ